MMMPTEDKWISIPCIVVHQPIGRFYIGSFPARELVEISFADRRRILEQQREIEIVSGIQREISPKRVAELRQYVNHLDACFPTGIILAISSDDAIYDKKTGTMSVRYASEVAKIIDGQHRIEGLVGYNGPKFELNVTIFINMEMEDQAIVFSTINLKQAPVANSLAYDLYDYATTRSPQKTCHYVARLLNSREKSPFYQRIMILGTATGKPNETLTQAAFIDPLLKLVSTNPMDDRDAIKRKIELPLISEGEIRTKKLVFRNMFIQDEDARIAKVIWNYFDAVRERWPEAWNLKQRSLILNRTTGFRALMQFLPLIILSLDWIGKVPDTNMFLAIFNEVKLDDKDLNTERFKPGTSGQSELRKAFEFNTRISADSVFKGTGRRALEKKPF